MACGRQWGWKDAVVVVVVVLCCWGISLLINTNQVNYKYDQNDMKEYPTHPKVSTQHEEQKSTDDEIVDIEELPDQPKYQTTKLATDETPTIIAFDIECTDLSMYVRCHQLPHITQIAAVEIKSGAKFDEYVIPKKPIALVPQMVTSMVYGPNGMKLEGNSISSRPFVTVVDEFLKWLKQYQKVVLVTQNGKLYDFPVLISSLASIKRLDQFCSIVIGLTDSIPLFKKAFPAEKSWRQDLLAKSVLNSTYKAHDALEDVRSLGMLVDATKLSKDEFMSFTAPPVDTYNALQEDMDVHKNLPSIEPLIAAGVVTQTLGEKIAGSGLRLMYLNCIFEREEEDGLRRTFASKYSDGQPRVTDSKKVLDEVIPKLAEYFKKSDFYNSDVKNLDKSSKQWDKHGRI